MVTEIVNAGQSAVFDGKDTRVTWAKQRTFAQGNVKVNITDISMSVKNPVSGDPVTQPFHHVTYEIGLYRRAGANSILVATKTLTKYWGQETGYVTITAVPAGGYSLTTRPRERWVTATQKSGLAGQGWCEATFELYHH